jgi:hypothetical protein
VRRIVLLLAPLLALLLGLGSCASSPGLPVRIGAEPATFHIVYRAEDGTGGRRVVTTVRWWVRRPFDGRREVLAGEPPGGQLVSLAVTSFGRSLTQTAGNDALVLAVPPQPAVADVRVGPVLSDALRRGALTRAGRRVIAGRPCQVYRIDTSAATGGPLAPPAKRASGYSDMCVDGAGLVLERTDVAGGKRLHDEVAVTVAVGARSMSDSLFEAPAPNLDVQHGGGSIRRVDPASRPAGTFYELPAPPTGFRLLGRYAVVPPQPENFKPDDPTRRSARLAGVADVYVRGADVVIVDRGGTLGGVAPFAPQPLATTIDVGALGKGELIASVLVSNARIALSGGHYLRVVGTVPPAQLVLLLRSLQAQPGGELIYLDHP